MTSTAITCRTAADAADVLACQTLRHMCFRGTAGVDRSAYDDVSSHVMIMRGARLLCTMRLRVFAPHADVTASYTGGFYDFGPFDGPSLEVGRFCIRADAFSADILRLAWGALTAWVTAHGISHLFGCASFAGTDPNAYADAFGLLAAGHVSNMHIAPQDIDSNPLSAISSSAIDRKLAQAQLPPLLRSYLGMGGYVGADAIIDHDLGTVLVFAGLDIAEIPPARAKSLRSLAKGLHIATAHHS